MKILIALGVLFALNTNAAEIKGFTREVGTNLDLIATTINMTGANIQGTNGTASGIDGEFDFKDLKPGKYKIEFSYVSYASETVVIEIDEDDDMVEVIVKLTPNMNEVEINYSKFFSERLD